MDDQPNGSMQPVDSGQVQPRRTIPDEPSQVGRNIKAVVWALVLVGLAVLIIQNWTKVELEVFFWTFTVQLTWRRWAHSLPASVGRSVSDAIRKRRTSTKRPTSEPRGPERTETCFCDMLAPLEYARCALRTVALAVMSSQGKGRPNGLSVLIGSARDAR